MIGAVKNWARSRRGPVVGSIVLIGPLGAGLSEGSEGSVGSDGSGEGDGDGDGAGDGNGASCRFRGVDEGVPVRISRSYGFNSSRLSVKSSIKMIS